MNNTLVLQHVKTNQLPGIWARKLGAAPSQKFTVKIELEHPPKKQNPLFGIWNDHTASRNVERYMDTLRKPRKC